MHSTVVHLFDLRAHIRLFKEVELVSQIEEG
jgi:hypothetical protein